MRRLLDPAVVALAGIVVVLGAIILVDSRGEDRDEQTRRDAQVQLVRSQRAGCERSKLDRRDNAGGWRTAERARRAAWERDHQAEDLTAAEDYAARAARLERRSRIDCTAAFAVPSQ